MIRRTLVPASFVLLCHVCASAQEPPPIAFDHYHSLAEIEAYLEGVADRHGALATLHVIGHSREGRPIWAVDVNNPETGPASEKPGFYVDGNIHGGEVLGGEGALGFLDRLLERYGRDERVTRLVDTRAFYVVPIVNPDGRRISIQTPENHRWNVRPVDQDGDGLVDEDPPEDLDGDGRLLNMRVADPVGRWAPDPEEPRRMIRVPDDHDGPRYRLLSEGVDNDGDGRFNEDQVGGVDLNRNFPSNWSPAQFASGPFPLSEPETWALVDYITRRPNIAAVHTFHTSGGLLLRFPTLAHQDWEFPEQDIADYRAIADDGVAITGYEHYADAKQAIVDLMSPGHGVFNDWASNVFGVLAMTTEMWANGFGRGADAVWRWNDEVLGGTGFIGWYAFDHPQLGEVELGGWDRWSRSNPPEPMIAEEVRRNVDWVLTFAEKTPRVRIVELDVEPGENGAGRMVGRVANVGWMSTSTGHAERLGIARPVMVEVTLENATFVDGSGRADLGVLAGTRGGEPDVRALTWTYRVNDPAREARATVVVASEKGGTDRSTVVLR